MHVKQIATVINLSAPQRYDHFIKRVADRDMVWGLYADGWARAGTVNGTPVFPIWPEKEYAKLCAVGEWKDFTPTKIALEELLHELIPSLRARKTALGVFPTPEDKGIVPDLSDFVDDILNELDKFR